MQSMRHASQKNVNWLCGVGIAIFCLHVSAAASWTTEQLIDEAVIRKWEAYERFARKLQGKVRSTTISFESGSAKEQRGWAVYKQNQKCVLWSRSIGEENLTELISIANPQYAADLKRSGTNLGDVVLQRFSETGEQPKREEPPVFERVLSSVSPHFYLHHKIPLSRILVDPRLKIQKMSKIFENGRELVRMDYRAVDELQPRARLRHVFVNSGWVDLDPSQCWCIVRTKLSYEFTTNGVRKIDNETESELSTVAHPSGFPLVKKITTRETQHLYSKERTRTINYRLTMDFEWEVNDSVPDSEFTLTAYGLPEPGGEPVKKNLPLYVWIILAAAVCIGLAVGFRFLARRARSEPAG
jgi:hypothetical protein